jgi:hypothetical protein
MADDARAPCTWSSNFNIPRAIVLPIVLLVANLEVAGIKRFDKVTKFSETETGLVNLNLAPVDAHTEAHLLYSRELWGYMVPGSSRIVGAWTPLHLHAGLYPSELTALLIYYDVNFEAYSNIHTSTTIDGRSKQFRSRNAPPTTRCVEDGPRRSKAWR